MQENARDIELSKSEILKEKTEQENAWHQRLLSGFIESADRSWKNPADTAAFVASGLAIGAAIQTGVNHAELLGGRVGKVAALAKNGLFYIPPLLMGSQIARADDGFKEAGKAVFDYGLFLFAANMGKSVDNVRGLGRISEPHAMTKVPEGLRFRLKDGMAHIDRFPTAEGMHQVRLSNGQGFIVSSNGRYLDRPTATLFEMPKTLGTDGKLTYSSSTTTLQIGAHKFERDLASGLTTVRMDGKQLRTGGNGFVDEIAADGSIRRFMGDGSQKLIKSDYEGTLFKDGSAKVLEGSYQSGRQWSFGTDGSISMRSLPAGKYRLDLNAAGEGTYHFTHGTSRGIMGMTGGMGGRTNSSPLKIDTYAARLDGSTIKTPGMNFELPVKPTAAQLPDFSRLLSVEARLSSIYAY